MREYILVFMLYFVMDWLWAAYISAIGKDKAMIAALWSVALTGASGASMLLVVHTPWAMISGMLGGFLGVLTYMSFKNRKWKT